jgi:hypothetical protein
MKMRIHIGGKEPYITLLLRFFAIDEVFSLWCGVFGMERTYPAFQKLASVGDVEKQFH